MVFIFSLCTEKRQMWKIRLLWQLQHVGNSSASCDCQKPFKQDKSSWEELTFIVRVTKQQRHFSCFSWAIYLTQAASVRSVLHDCQHELFMDRTCTLFMKWPFEFVFAETGYLLCWVQSNEMDEKWSHIQFIYFMLWEAVEKHQRWIAWTTAHLFFFQYYKSSNIFRRFDIEP